MVAGGFAVAGNRIGLIEQAIVAIKEQHGIVSEFHWSKYRGGYRKKPAYEGIVDLGFDLVRKRHAALHLLVAKFGGFDHGARTSENKDTSVNRMYYQLCLHRLARYYGRKRAIHVRLDEGADCQDVCAMRNQLCADAFKKLGANPNCIRSIEPVDSQKSPIVQMADVIVGAVAAKRNRVVHRTEKGNLADYVLRRSGLKDWDKSTPSGARFLSVWNFEGSCPSRPYS